MNIQFSEKAAQEVKRLLSQEGDADLKLRLGVQGGGCSGLNYYMVFDKNVTEQDVVKEMRGVEVVIDSKSAVYLEGAEVDYTDGLSGAGFVFNNPNAQKTCGCGSSFAV